MNDTIAWLAVIVAGVALLIAAIGAVLALLSGHARFIEIAWVSIAASLFFLASDRIGKRLPYGPAIQTRRLRWVRAALP